RTTSQPPRRDGPSSGTGSWSSARERCRRRQLARALQLGQAGLDAFEGCPDVGLRVRVAEAQVPLAEAAEGRAREPAHPAVVQQVVCDLDAGTAEGAD